MDQQVRDEHLDQAAPHSVGHNTSQITAMFMIYGMVGSSMGFSLHLPHLMGPTCAIAVRGASSVIWRTRHKRTTGPAKGQGQHRLDARADAPGACRSSEKERPERINEAIYGY